MENKVSIKIKRISPEFSDIPLPAYATEGSAGMDVRAAVESEVIIPSGKIALIPTNLQAEIPEGFELQVRPRSGLAVKNGIGVLNSPGTIDSDYRGEIKIILINFGEMDFAVKRGERIAQMVLSRVYSADLAETGDLSETAIRILIRSKKEVITTKIILPARTK